MLYHAVVEIPDDELIDNRLPASFKYLALNKITSNLTLHEKEGYLEKLDTEMLSSVGVSSVKVSEGDVIIFKFPEDTLPEDAALVKDILTKEFPDNKVLGLTSSIETLVASPKEAVDMLNRMIAHIKIVNI